MEGITRTDRAPLELTATEVKTSATLYTTERALDYAGLVPVLCELSGGVRMIGGIFEAVIGFVLSCYYDSKKADSPDDGTLAGRASYYEEMIGHGFANMFRGLIEITWIASVIFTVINDGIFENRYKYEQEPTNLPSPAGLVKLGFRSCTRV